MVGTPYDLRYMASVQITTDAIIALANLGNVEDKKSIHSIVHSHLKIITQIQFELV